LSRVLQKVAGLMIGALALGADEFTRADDVGDCLARMHATDIQAQCARDPTGAIGSVSCQSVHSMIESARLACEKEAQARRERAEQERQRELEKEVDDLVAKLKEYGLPAVYEDLAEDALGAAPDHVESMRKRLLELRPDYDVNALPDAGVVAGFVTRERKCRLSRRCMSARAYRKAEEKFFAETLGPMCRYSRDLQILRREVARERSSPPGAVDTEKMKKDQQRAKDDRERIKELTPAYVARRHHAFGGWQTEPRCVEAEKSGQLKPD